MLDAGQYGVPVHQNLDNIELGRPRQLDCHKFVLESIASLDPIAAIIDLHLLELRLPFQVAIDHQVHQ